MYVLDTNVLSELRPGKPQQSEIVRSWANTIPSTHFFLSAVSLLELEIGILRLERRTPPQGSAMRRWFDALRETFASRVLSFDAAAAERCAPLHVPDVKSFRDSMIAASALEHGFVLVTRNVADFQIPSLRLINPWEFTHEPPTDH